MVKIKGPSKTMIKNRKRLQDLADIAQEVFPEGQVFIGTYEHCFSFYPTKDITSSLYLVSNRNFCITVNDPNDLDNAVKLAEEYERRTKRFYGILSRKWTVEKEYSETTDIEFA